MSTISPFPGPPMSADPLQTEVQFVRGVGPARAELLAKLDLRTVDDLFWNLPREVLDLTDVRDVAQLEPDLVQTVCGRVVDRDSRTISKGRTMTGILLDCQGQYVRGVWFNQPWMLHKFKDGDLVLFSAKPKRKGGRWEMSNPRVQFLSEGDDGRAGAGVIPQYGLTDGISQHEMRRAIHQAVAEFSAMVVDPVPEPVQKQNRLLPLREAVRQVHLPATMEEYLAGRRTMLFHDLFDFQLALALRRRFWKRRSAAPRLPTTAKIDARIRRLFPFSLTTGQEQAIREIVADLDSGHAMHRLLQADVGAGKTAVAIYAMLVAVAAGKQAAVMAPTELLASQHWRTIDAMLSQSRVNRVLLTGQLTAAERRAAHEGIRQGTIQLVVGTQALIQKDLEFAQLGLAVIDEQHKFGVRQRAALSGAEEATHILVMTATPIPRSLCLTQFGDLDLSVIQELPPGRQTISTHRVGSQSQQTKAWEFIRKKLREGRQAYIVCPRVEAGEGGSGNGSPEMASAEEVFEMLREGELKGFALGLVHGQMDRDLRALQMEMFRDGRIQALVATTVVEVGVDVPNATLIVILNADRFGLSQLHQLRGRIGRGKFQGYCFLFSEAEKPDSLARLEALEKTASGFEIAEADFRLRGPGDALGTRQHGDLPLRVADLLRDQDLLFETRIAAFELVNSGQLDEPEFAPLKTRVLDRFEQQMELSGTG